MLGSCQVAHHGAGEDEGLHELIGISIDRGFHVFHSEVVRVTHRSPTGWVIWERPDACRIDRHDSRRFSNLSKAPGSG